MSYSPEEFRPIFNRVMDQFCLSSENREVAWESCFLRDVNGKDYLDGDAVKIYKQLAGT